jgi:hypothetical protein
MNLQVNGQYVTKGTLMLLDLITTNNWERPIYFNNTSLASIGINLDDHVVMEGLTYRLLPIRKPDFIREELVNPNLAMKNYMEKFAFRGMDNPDAYLDEEYRRFASNHRSALNSIAIALLDQDKLEDAATLLNYGLKVMPHEAIPYDLSSGQSVPLFFEVGEDEKAMDIIDKVSKKSLDMIEFYTAEDRPYDRDMMISVEMVKYFIPLLEERGYEEKSEELKTRLKKYVDVEESGSSRIQRR